jgi:hypothetical protein
MIMPIDFCGGGQIGLPVSRATQLCTLNRLQHRHASGWIAERDMGTLPKVADAIKQSDKSAAALLILGGKLLLQSVTLGEECVVLFQIGGGFLPNLCSAGGGDCFEP